MSSRCDDVGVPDRRGNNARSHQPGDVGDVGQQVRADRVGNAAEGLPVGDPGIGREAADDHLGLALLGLLHDGFVVDLLGLRVDRVVDNLIQLPRAVVRVTMREMPPVQQVHAHDGRTGFHQRGVDGVIGWRAGERLYVDINLIGSHTIGGEGLGAATAGQGFDGIRVFCPLVITRVRVAAEVRQSLGVVEDFFLGHPARVLVGIAFGVDVLESRGHGIPNGQRGLTLGRDQDQFADLPFGFNLS